jgi:hypothetical protein
VPRSRAQRKADTLALLRTEPGDYVYLRVTPTEIRAWREANELSGRLLMRDGVWLPGLPLAVTRSCKPPRAQRRATSLRVNFAKRLRLLSRTSGRRRDCGAR